MSHHPEELVRLCLRKDPAAWRQFVSRYAPLVHHAIRRTFNRYQFPFQTEDLEDCLQQVFFHLWEKGLKQAKGIRQPEGWLVIVTYRVTLDWMRKERGRNRLISLDTLLPDPAKDPRLVLETFSAETSLEEGMSTLPEREAVLLRLNLVEGRTHAEIAELLRLPAGTVSYLIKQAKGKVAHFLKKHLGEK